MKRILLLFLLILGACSDQETVKPTQTPEVISSDNSNARVENTTCEGKEWEGDVIAGTYTFGSVASEHIYPTGDAAWRVSPYQITMTFRNTSLTTSVKIKVPANSFLWETLSPGELYTPSNPMFSMSCICDTDCPFQQYVGHDYNFKVSNLFGNQTPVYVQVGYIINSPHGWWGPSQIAYDMTLWQP